MKGGALVLAGAFLMLLSGLAGYYLHDRLTHGSPSPPGRAAPPLTSLAMRATEGTQRPDFTLPDIEAIPRNVAEWDGKVLAVNFWATWCPPCLEEIPEFIDLQTQYGAQGLQFVGVAIDDLDNVKDFIDRFGINYPILIGEQDANRLAKIFGNDIGALPYTAIIDRTGRIVFTKRGQLSRAEAVAVIEALL